MPEIILKTPAFVFSYRVAGILIHDNKILLQKPLNDDGYAIPGGHVAFGEISENTLMREFREEIGADIIVERLVLVGENFFPWGEKLCQQICLYYLVSLCDPTQIPLEGSFRAYDEIFNKRIDLEFSWLPLAQVNKIKLYPLNIVEHLLSLPDHIQHFIFRE
jgi:ADP-ribose pyrophosphatase YjhB (NUDIX family)